MPLREPETETPYLSQHETKSATFLIRVTRANDANNTQANYRRSI